MDFAQSTIYTLCVYTSCKELEVMYSICNVHSLCIRRVLYLKNKKGVMCNLSTLCVYTVHFLFYAGLGCVQFQLCRFMSPSPYIIGFCGDFCVTFRKYVYITNKRFLVLYHQIFDFFTFFENICPICCIKK